MDLDVLKVKFTHSNTVRDKKPYTIYEIEVRSSSTITWVIYKRYSSFHQLHQDLTKSTSITQEQKINLPQLPPKRLTRSLAVEFVEKRKNELQDYLRALLETPGLVHSPVILSFLEVPDSVRPMLAAAMQHQQHGLGGLSGGHVGGLGLGSGHLGGAGSGGFDHSGLNSGGLLNSSASSSKLSYASKTPDERRILELIDLLKFHPNKVTAIKNFEEWFFETRPRLSPEFIKLLLHGKTGGSEDGPSTGAGGAGGSSGGLLQTIGEISYSHVASRAALYLLCRLLDVEKNKDAHLFLEQFVNLDVLTLKKMQINQHILSERGNRIGAFKIIQILKNTPPGTGLPQRSEQQVEQIVNDAWALREYYKWSDRKSDTSGQIVPFNHTTSQNKDHIYMKSLNLSSTTTTSATGSTSSVPSPHNQSMNAKKQAQTAASAGAPGTSDAFPDTDLSQMRILRLRISEIFQDLKRVAEEKEVFVTNIEGSFGGSGNSTTRDSVGMNGAWRIVSLVQPFEPTAPATNGGKSLMSQPSLIPVTTLPDTYDDDVSLIYKTCKSDIVIVKMTCILPYTMEEVAPYLADLRRRREWDLKFHKGKCLEVRQTQEYSPPSPTHANQHPISLQYPEYHTDIVHMIFKSFSSPYKYRDVVTIRAFARVEKTRAEFEAEGYKSRQNVQGGAFAQQQLLQQQSDEKSNDPNGAGMANANLKEFEEPLFKGEGIFKDGGMMFGTRSVIHPLGPEFKDNVRAVLYPSGYILTPVRDQGLDIHLANGQTSFTNEFGSSCKLTMITQMDRESVLIVSPDLLGETNELRQTFTNIKACLARDYGLRTLRSSIHTQQIRLFSGRNEAASRATGSLSTVTQDHPAATPGLTYQQRPPIGPHGEEYGSPQKGLPVIHEQHPRRT